VWHCSKCEERIGESFDVCWQCGTSYDGVEDPDFVSETTSDRPDEATPVPWQYSLKTLFGLVFLAALALGLWYYLGALAVFTMVCVGIVNILGVLAGWFVTSVLRFPNDGSLNTGRHE